VRFRCESYSRPLRRSMARCARPGFVPLSRWCWRQGQSPTSGSKPRRSTTKLKLLWAPPRLGERPTFRPRCHGHGALHIRTMRSGSKKRRPPRTSSTREGPRCSRSSGSSPKRPLLLNPLRSITTNIIFSSRMYAGPGSRRHSGSSLRSTWPKSGVRGRSIRTFRTRDGCSFSMTPAFGPGATNRETSRAHG
jgi:hypothetical protein